MQPPPSTAILALTLTLSATALAARAGEPDHHDPVEHARTEALLVDTDMALDDVRALLALLAAPGVDVAAVATVGGSASVGRGTDNLLGLLESLHRGDIGIARGAVCPSPAPPWRDTVEGLAGASFPPPQHTTAAPWDAAWLAHVAEEHGGAVEVLALGPLTNLGGAVEADPGVLGAVSRIWIPFRRPAGTALEGYNLDTDLAAAGALFAGAAEIVLVDVSGAADLDVAGLLRETTGDAPAARWIKRTLGSLQPVHWMLHDELAAAALVHPDLLDWEDGRYRVEATRKGPLRLAPASDGNVRLATLRDPAEAAAELQRLWQSPIAPRGEDHHEHVPVEARNLREQLRSFHGHLGPYVVLGYRMGRAGLDALGSDGHFGVSAHVHSPLSPPPSCLIDGVQLGSGCTLGKRNIEVSEAEAPAWVELTTTGGASVVVRLLPDVPGRVEALVDELGVEAAGDAMLAAPDEELFEVAPGAATPEPAATGDVPRGRFYAIGVGPAGPDLATRQALQTIARMDVLLASEAHQEAFAAEIGDVPVAYDPWKGLWDLDGTPIWDLDDEQRDAFAHQRFEVRDRRVAEIEQRLARGEDVGLLDQGNPCVFGPSHWYLEAFGPEDVVIIPGMGCDAAALATLGRSGIPAHGARFLVQTAPFFLTETPGIPGPHYSLDHPGAEAALADLAKHEHTLLIYMGLTDPPALFAALGRHYPTETPAACVFWAGDPERERIVRGTVADLGERLAEEPDRFMGLLLIGGFLEGDPYEAAMRRHLP